MENVETITPHFEGIHHINFSVTDLDRSAAWYQDVLGLTPGWEMPDVEGRGQKVVLLQPGSQFRFVLSYHTRNDGEAASEFRAGMDHIALTVADRSELEAWARRFDEKEVPHSEIKEGATGWLITFRDPDNIQFEVYTVTKD
jgi:glyoxylase I family protein